MRPVRSRVSGLAGSAAVLALAGTGWVACSQASEDPVANPNKIIRLLAEGHAVFGIFSGDHTAEQGRVMAQNDETDFVFYSLENGPFDIPAMESYMQGLAEGAGDTPPHPVTLRIPPIRDDHAAALDHVRQGLAAGADAIVFPHVETAEEAALAVSAMGDNVWPGNPGGALVNVLLLEDQVAIANAREIVATPGVSIAIPGPGDLRRAYDGDAAAIENAIQTVLGACKEFDVPCGITAGVNDIAERLDQGFQVIIVTQPEALAVGLEAAGRRE